MLFCLSLNIFFSNYTVQINIWVEVETKTGNLFTGSSNDQDLPAKYLPGCLVSSKYSAQFFFNTIKYFTETHETHFQIGLNRKLKHEWLDIFVLHCYVIFLWTHTYRSKISTCPVKRIFPDSWVSHFTSNLRINLFFFCFFFQQLSHLTFSYRRQ